MVRKKVIISLIIACSCLLIVAIYYFRLDLSILYHRVSQEPSTADSKNESIFKRYPRYLYGIDLSHYQGKIDWNQVNYINDSIPIAFIIIRATMGIDGLDSAYITRWETIKSKQVVRGAYHYYRPNQHSLTQAAQFKAHVTLNPGDFPPILDIENLSTIQSVEDLKLGIKKWLVDVELHYGVTPIIYTGDHFYRKHLNTPEFDKYPIWIANYGNYVEPFTQPWSIWQFTERGQIDGVEGYIDLNVFKGNYQDFKEVLIK